ncbi:MAG TPA: Sir2 family NAD-dependent protein deacetylase [Spirochaetota bacterium]|nr:Sir2 family NAD-dependent protein deacetylase [Spirochaetota bacterium]
MAAEKAVNLTIDAVASSRNIIVLTGAGISTASGIPDFRTPGTGLYDNLAKYQLPYPEAVFTLGYFKKNPRPFFSLVREFTAAHFKPNAGHCFIKELETAGKLRRVYTQNIDNLELKAGIKKVIACHGTMQTAHCLACGRKYSYEDIRDNIAAGKVPLCSCKDRGLIKPDVVFFGESLPAVFFSNYQQDFSACDLLLVIGSSLSVEPVASLPRLVPADAVKILINNQSNTGFEFDTEVIGDITAVCEQLIKSL